MTITRLELSRHQSIAAAILTENAPGGAVARKLHTKLAASRGTAHRMNIGQRQAGVLLGAALDHLAACEGGCLLDESAGEFILALTPKPGGDRPFDADATVEAGTIMRHPMLFTADLIVRVRSTYTTTMDAPGKSAGQCVDLDIVAGGYGDRDTTFALSEMTTRAYTLYPIDCP